MDHRVTKAECIADDMNARMIHRKLYGEVEAKVRDIFLQLNHEIPGGLPSKAICVLQSLENDLSFTKFRSP